jgi:hypothetical protein
MVQRSLTLPSHPFGHLAQTIPAQAVLLPAAISVLTLDRHRQTHGFVHAPAGLAEAARKYRSAGGTGEAARVGAFFPICHQTAKSFAVIFMSGSFPAAL